MSTTRFTKNEYLQGSMLSVSRRKVTPISLHAHEYYEMELVLSGEGEHTIGGVTYSIGPGSMFLLTPADFHALRPYNSMRLWNIAFDEALVPHRYRQLFYQGVPTAQLDADALARADAAAALLQQEQQTGCFQPLLEYLLHFLHPAPSAKSLSPIDSALAYIRTHFRENPSLAEVAASVALSPVYFSSLFKKTVGQTFVSYLAECKLDCAKMLLQNGMSVTEACFASGFGSLSGFGYTFRQKVGLSPSDYQLSFSKN